MTRPARIVLAILDAYPHGALPPDLAPTLRALAEAGGQAPHGGHATLAASTYPNHATFVTGVDPARHRILTTRALVDGELRPAHEVGPAAPTLFDRCRAAGRRAVGVFGDQNLVGVCGARAAHRHWPPDGVLPEKTARGPLGYAADRAVLAALDEMELESAELVVLQLDELDSVRHLHGPGSEEESAQLRASDAALGEVVQRLEADWHETVIIVLSDHDHEAAMEGAMDLRGEAARRGLDVLVDHDGTAALVVGDVSEAILLEIPGITGCARLDGDAILVWGDPGQQFGMDWGLKGQHGSPRTATQLAIVSGGHPAVSGVTRTLAKAPPAANSWAGLICDLLEI